MVSVFLSVSILFCSIVLNNNSKTIRRFHNVVTSIGLLLVITSASNTAAAHSLYFACPLSRGCFNEEGRLGRSKPLRGNAIGHNAGQAGTLRLNHRNGRPSIKGNKTDPSLATGGLHPDVPNKCNWSVKRNCCTFFEWLLQFPVPTSSRCAVGLNSHIFMKHLQEELMVLLSVETSDVSHDRNIFGQVVLGRTSSRTASSNLYRNVSMVLCLPFFPTRFKQPSGGFFPTGKPLGQVRRMVCLK